MSRIIPFNPEADPEYQPDYPPQASASAFPATVLEPAPDFSAALLSAEDLVTTPMPRRTALLGQWMKQGDLGYLFAPRGAGKSWMAMLIAQAVADGLPLGQWSAGEAPRPVIYFDAEMNLADVQERSCKLGIHSPNFQWLSNERLFLTSGQGVNIASPVHQAGLSAMLPDGCFFIIDNLSTAQLGMGENDNDSFDAVRDWLLSLRHRHITVMIVHHAGRNGAMRGSSRREDMAHWVISLKDATDTDATVKAFITSFDPPGGKVRNCQAREVPALKWTLKDEGETFTLGCQIETGADAMLQHIREGVTSATDLAELLGVATGTVSKLAKRLIEAGHIAKSGREYRVVG